MAGEPHQLGFIDLGGHSVDGVNTKWVPELFQIGQSL
jgi:hypothetical protein